MKETFRGLHVESFVTSELTLKHMRIEVTFCFETIWARVVTHTLITA